MFRGQEHVIKWRAERARLDPRPDERTGYKRFSLVPIAGAAPLSVGFVRHCIDEAERLGASEIFTPAVTGAEAAGLREAGFQERSALHLLVHDLALIPPASSRRPAPDSRSPSFPVERRANRAPRESILAVDAAAFGPEWCLDSAGLDEALEATPSVRFRMVGDPGSVLGYAVTGRAGRRGYLQRLAVDPNVQRLGIGRSLVADSLRWCKRWRAERVVVNTQIGNTIAYELYRKMGFVDAPIGLYVLHLRLGAELPDSVAASPS